MSESETIESLEAEIKELLKDTVKETQSKHGNEEEVKTSDNKLDNIDVAKTKELNYEYDELINEEGEQEGGLELE